MRKSICYCRINSVFCYISFNPKIVIVWSITFNWSSYQFHFVCSLPRSGNHLVKESIFFNPSSISKFYAIINEFIKVTFYEDKEELLWINSSCNIRTCHKTWKQVALWAYKFRSLALQLASKSLEIQIYFRKPVLKHNCPTFKDLIMIWPWSGRTVANSLFTSGNR